MVLCLLYGQSLTNHKFLKGHIFVSSMTFRLNFFNEQHFYHKSTLFLIMGKIIHENEFQVIFHFPEIPVIGGDVKSATCFLRKNMELFNAYFWL